MGASMKRWVSPQHASRTRTNTVFRRRARRGQSPAVTLAAAEMLVAVAALVG